MTTFSVTDEQLKILRAIVSHALENKLDAEDELDIKLDGIEELESMLYAGTQNNLEMF